MKPWLQGRLALSQQTSRFELPMDVKLLAGKKIYYQYVVPKNINTSPMEWIFSKTCPPLWKFQ